MKDERIPNVAKGDRKYYWKQTRERSMAKGYGFGKLSQRNHFDSEYGSSQLRGFADDYFFTPAVYDYIRGEGVCTALYRDFATTVGGFTKFADYDGTWRVRFTEEPPTSITVPHDGPYSDWVDVPILSGSTHRCWNWGRPDICWDQLKALGFPNGLIGSRPQSPDQENAND